MIFYNLAKETDTKNTMIKRLLTLLCMQLAFCCTIFAANYLTFTAEKDSSAFSIEDHDIKSNIFYSLDNGKTWNKLTDQPVKLAKGDRALLKGTGPNQKPSWRNYSTFKMEGSIAASGSVMSLVDGDGESKTIPYAYCFYGLFQDCTSLTQAPELPATTLAERCYDKMFSFCFRLTQAPELPATKLAKRVLHGDVLRMHQADTGARTTSYNFGRRVLQQHVSRMYQSDTGTGTAGYTISKKLLQQYVQRMLEIDKSTGTAGYDIRK